MLHLFNCFAGIRLELAEEELPGFGSKSPSSTRSRTHCDSWGHSGSPLVGTRCCKANHCLRSRACCCGSLRICEQVKPLLGDLPELPPYPPTFARQWVHQYCSLLRNEAALGRSSTLTSIMRWLLNFWCRKASNFFFWHWDTEVFLVPVTLDLHIFACQVFVATSGWCWRLWAATARWRALLLSKCGKPIGQRGHFHAIRSDGMASVATATCSLYFWCKTFAGTSGCRLDPWCFRSPLRWSGGPSIQDFITDGTCPGATHGLWHSRRFILLLSRCPKLTPTTRDMWHLGTWFDRRNWPCQHY